MHSYLALFFLLSFCSYIVQATESAHLADSYHITQGDDFKDCSTILESRNGGWCEIRHSDKYPSISSVWPENPDKKILMRTGPSSILHAWNSAAFDQNSNKLYFMGGGHADYGGNEVYEFDLDTGKWSRLTNPSPLDKLYVLADYTSRSGKPWRRLCWMPDVRKFPASAHTYDGVIFSNITSTIFLYVMGAANGSCLEDKKNRFKNSPLVLGDKTLSVGWYEFNPDRVSERNGLSPLSWRKVFYFDDLGKKSIHQGYPVSTEFPNGEIVFGSKYRTQKYDPRKPSILSMMPLSSQADYGDGNKIYDKKRNIIWSIHKRMLLAFDGSSGELLHKYNAKIRHGKSLAIAADGKLYSWDGISNVSVFDPDSKKRWKTLEWSSNGPPKGNGKVYGKWIYLKNENLFVGLSTHKTGVWIYKHPDNAKYTEYSDIDPQKLIDKANVGSIVIIPPGIYPQGLFVNKSLTIKMKGAILRDTVNNKGIINVSCHNCSVTIEDFHGDGLSAKCQWGNCAGIKAEGKGFKLTLRRAHINRTVMGIITDNRGGELYLEDSLIENTGLNDRSTTLGHGLYAGRIDRVVVRNSIIRRAFGDGHLFKSRAPDTLIENSVIAGLNGYHSRVIDFPCGGKLIIRNSVLQQGVNTDNIDLISVGTEPKSCKSSVKSSDVTLKSNWIIFDRDRSSDERSANHGETRLFTWRAPMNHVAVTGNKFVEPIGELNFGEKKLSYDWHEQNILYRSRSEAGIDPVELPDIHVK
ncbi:MAG: hypothetical protein GY777_22330 [Candidatus Brocadiaceae bacterium]|nr:hypothetical protein [Candidatus Brocadiaceae bacterium]